MSLQLLLHRYIIIYILNAYSLAKRLHLANSFHWFERCDTVPKWIQLAIENCQNGIKNAILDDSHIPVTNYVNFSTSARSTHGFLLGVGTFWNNLDWPEPVMSFCYAVRVVHGIAESCLYYVSESAKRLDCVDEMFDEKGDFRFNQKV